MNRSSGVLLTMFAAGAFGASTSVLADNPLGAYIGAGAGVSNVGNDNYSNNYGYNGNFGNNLVWKVMAGIRPISIVGAELEYIDFGSNNGHDGYYGNYYFFGPNSHPKATVLYGVGYLPLPLPFLDVYGKLGAARLQTDITSFSYPPGYGTCAQPVRPHSLPHRSIGQQVRVWCRSANALPRFRVPCRIRGHQFAVRQPRSLYGRLYLDVLGKRRPYLDVLGKRRRERR